MRKHFFVLGLVLLLLFGVAIGHAQETDHLQMFRQLLNDWNAGKLVLSKKSLEPYFEGELKRRLTVRQFGYENEDWAKKRRAMWKSLDSEVARIVPISKQGRMLLVGYFAYNLEQYRAIFPVTAAKNDLQMKGALILGPAQKSVLQKQLNIIDVRSLLEAMANNETFTWPDSEPSVADIEPSLRQ